MVTSGIVIVCIAQILFLAKHWMRVTARDRNAAKLHRLRQSLDWRRPGHRSRIAAGVPGFGVRQVP